MSVPHSFGGDSVGSEQINYLIMRCINHCCVERQSNTFRLLFCVCGLLLLNRLLCYLIHELTTRYEDNLILYLKYYSTLPDLHGKAVMPLYGLDRNITLFQL